MWWPGTELNRRRQPFQGCSLPNPGEFRRFGERTRPARSGAALLVHPRLRGSRRATWGYKPEKLLRQLSRQTVKFVFRNVLERNRQRDARQMGGKLVDPIIRNDEVVGSIPTSSTIFSSTCKPPLTNLV